MGRPPIGTVAMTAAERQRRRRASQPAPPPKPKAARKLTKLQVSEVKYWVRYPDRLREGGLGHEVIGDMVHGVDTPEEWTELSSRYHALSKARKAARPPRPPPQPPAPRVMCCLSCNKPRAEVRMMVAIGGYAYLCDGCIAEMSEIVAAALAKQEQPADVSAE
jgi:ClpX C4-type zinc finger